MIKLLFQTTPFIKSHLCALNLNVKYLYLTHTPLGHSGSESDGHEGVLAIHQNSSITGISRYDCLLSYPGQSLRGWLTSMQSGDRFIQQSQPTRLTLTGTTTSGQSEPGRYPILPRYPPPEYKNQLNVILRTPFLWGEYWYRKYSQRIISPAVWVE